MSSGADDGRGRPRAVRRATTVPSRGGGIAPPPGSGGTRDPLSSSQHGVPGPGGGGRQGRRLTTIGVGGVGGVDEHHHGDVGPPANIHSRAASMGFHGGGGTGSDSGTAATASTTKSSIPDRGGRHAHALMRGSPAAPGGSSAPHLSDADALLASASDLVDEDDQRANLEALAQYNEEGGGGNENNEEFYEDIYPTLHNLNELLADAARKKSSKLPSTVRGAADAATAGGSDQISLDDLLTAANKDVESYRERLSQLRMRMYGGQVTKADVTAMKLAQQKRRSDHEDTLTRLRNDAAVIVQQLQSAGIDGDVGEGGGKKNRRGVTQSDLRREKMARWQRALELYVLAPEAAADSSVSSGGGAAGTTGSGGQKKFDLLHLLDKLCENCDKEEELSEALTEASGMCNTLVDVTATAVRDAAEFAAETEDAYHIRLEAFSAFVETVAEDTERIGERFRTNGRAAMKIGQQLELAERRRRQCETASVLLRRWWMMESLAEEESDNPRGEINVNEEVCGKIPHSSCRMDPLFTQPRNGLEAARALKALRAVVRARGTSSTAPTSAGSPPVTPTAVGGSPTSAGVAGGIMLDPQSASRRFDLTSNLIHRTSAALESRLLNSFLEIHSAGGTYDFVNVRTKLNPVTKGNVLDWVTLRELAEALHTFDGGRKLHKRYVQQVITTKFPELFYFAASPKKDGGDKKKGGDDSGGEYSSEEEMELDLDETRTQLSALFHRVSEVCREEFALIAHVFSPATLPDHRGGPSSSSPSSYFGSEMPDATPFQVARALLQRIINDPRSGLAARINELLESVDRHGDFDAGAKKLDTFVVVHEKAAGLFYMLREAAESCLIAQGGGGGAGGGPGDAGTTGQDGASGASSGIVGTSPARQRAVTSLLQFLTAQQTALSNGQRRGYLNLELRLLHHECCATFDRIGAKLTKLSGTGGGRNGGGRQAPTSKSRAAPPGDATFDHYRAPLLPIDKDHLKKQGVPFILNGPMKPTTIRQPLIHATDSLARARLMFGGDTGTGGSEGDSTARVITAIYNQMCVFYGDAFLCPVIECLGEMLERNPPSTPPSLPFNEDQAPHNLGVDGNFWIGVERVNSAAKAFDRELWAEQRAGSARVWEILVGTGSQTSLTLAKERRLRFFRDIEERGEAAMLRALDAISAHIQWIVIAGESMLATGGNRLLQNLTAQDKGGGPYAVPAGSSLEATNSPAVQSLTFCLRAQFVSIQAALTPQSLSAFWTALSRRLYDIVCARLLLHYYVSNIGAVIFSRDVEALRAVAMLAGTDHSHWDTLKELLTLYMTPPDALKTILVGPEGDVHSGKGLFNRAGQDQSLVFMSRRIDFRNKTNTGMKTSEWATNLLSELGVPDPSERNINVALYSAERKV